VPGERLRYVCQEEATVLAPLLLVVVAFVAWKFTATGRRFLPEFAPLLSTPTLQQGLLSALSGRAYLTGRFRGRDVAIRLQSRRGRYQLGYLVVAMRTNGPPVLDANGLEAHVTDATGRQALFTIATQDLLLSVEGGWLKTMWQPVGFMIFPGRFEDDKWRPVLDAMSAIASSLDSSQHLTT
jgi:hypothetical protein